MKTSWNLLVAAILLACALEATAVPTAEEAARLGKELTPIGAERAGNTEGTIPEWTGGLCKPPAGYKPLNGKHGFPYVYPFDDEKPLYTITAANMAQYADKLDEGQLYLLKTYPTYRVDVYKTYRTACIPDWAYENTIKRVMSPKLVGKAPGLDGAHAQVPFPIPKTGYEVMWNWLTAFHPVHFGGDFETYLSDAVGNRTLVTRSKVRYQWDYWDNGTTTTDKVQSLLNANQSPPSKAGSMDMRVTWARMDQKEPRAWSYVPGQRRVRLAPEFTYDTVAAQYGGLILFDEISGFDGKMDRFDFKLVGKKELLIPYNGQRQHQWPIEKLMMKNHVNPDSQRYELHRVWIVEATRKAGARHINSRKVFYLDEDSWIISSEQTYDDAGKLYRSKVFPIAQRYDIPAPIGHNEVGYDHVKQGWYLGSRAVPGTEGWRQMDPAPPNYFTPENMAALGVR
jgi:hypothetical protein